jgi:hypothetical protein
MSRWCAGVLGLSMVFRASSEASKLRIRFEILKMSFLLLLTIFSGL